MILLEKPLRDEIRGVSDQERFLLKSGIDLRNGFAGIVLALTWMKNDFNLIPLNPLDSSFVEATIYQTKSSITA